MEGHQQSFSIGPLVLLNLSLVPQFIFSSRDSFPCFGEGDIRHCNPTYLKYVQSGDGFEVTIQIVLIQ